MAYERKGDNPELRVVSAGCSTGTEIDSMLALIKRSGREERIVMKGWDINEYALLAARAGRHYVPLNVPGRPFEWEPDELGDTLREYGFEVSQSGQARRRPGYLADSAPVRQDHGVEFVQCDLSEGVPAGKPADLIMANNMLYHLTTKKAEDVIRHLAASLAEHGVLSIGDTEYGYIPMKNGHGSTFRITYGEWLLKTVDSLYRESGVEPIASGLKGLPTMFAKV